MKSILLIILMLILSSGCSLIPKALRTAEKAAEEALDVEAESKIKTEIYIIPVRFRCPKCGHETEAEGAAVITKKDIEKRFALNMSREGPKFTWWQKVLRWFWGLGWIGLILAAIAFFAFPGALGALLGRIRPARSYKRLVQGLEDAKIKDNETVASFIRPKTSDRDKQRIKKWRKEGKI